MQYLIGFMLALLISTYVFSKRMKSRTCQFFFAFGFSVSMWALFAFFHRNAPSAVLSKDLFRLVMFFSQLVQGFLVSTILYIKDEKWYYPFVVVPTFIVGISLFALAPFDVIWTSYGWSYTLHSPWMMIYSSFSGVYLLAMIIILVIRVRRPLVRVLRKKYVLILGGYGVLYGIGMGITNVVISMNPAFPPLGGILLAVAFLVVAYAISLPAEKIAIPSKIYFGYPLLLNKLLQEAPGKELGQDLVEFNKFLRVTGLNEIVSVKEEKIIFNSNKLNSLNLLEPAERTLEYLEEHDWAVETRAHYKSVFIDTYLTTRKKSIKAADEWFKRMLRKHSGFFSIYGIMDAIPEDVELPKGVLDAILKNIKLPREYSLKEGLTYFFRGEGAEKGYEFFTGLTKHAKTLCFTGTNPQEVRDIYGLEGVPIVWVTFEVYAGGKTIPPNKLDELTATISEFARKWKGVVFVDCIDSMVMASGFKQVMGWLKGVKKIMTKSKSNLLVTIDPSSFSNRQLASIGREMKEIKVK